MQRYEDNKIQGPSIARAAFISWMGGDGSRPQQFPNDPKLDAHRHAQLKREGKIIIRRRVA